MHINSKSILLWLLVATMAYGAFDLGSGLRRREVASVPTPRSVTVQANALLNFIPECPPIPLAKANTTPSENRDLVSSVVRLVRAWYVDPKTGNPLTPDKEADMARGAVKGMLDSLSDPDSHFLDPKEKKLLDDASAGKFHGIGAILALRNEKKGDQESVKIAVIAPMSGSPSEAAGLKPGDIITHVGGKWIITYNPFASPEIAKAEKSRLNGEMTDEDWRKMATKAADKLKNGETISEALETLTAKDSGDVGITVERPGQNAPIEMKKVALGITKVEPVSSKSVGHSITYIRISQFNNNAASQFASQLDQAMKSSKTKAIVLDLRDNPGGQMDAAKEIASKLTGGGLFATIQEKSHRTLIQTQKTRGVKVQLVVLVNGGTANVAELVASDLKENAGAVLMGTKTFGDGMAQTPLMLKDGSEAVLTTGKMLTSRGFDFNGKGLEPAKLVTDDKRNGDTQLSEAERVLQARLGRV